MTGIETKRHVAIYCRVSSAQQTMISQSIDLDSWARQQAEEPVWYNDKFTGTTMKRPGFDVLMERIRRGKVSTLVVWRIDRLGRTASGLTALFDELIKRKVNLISLRDCIDLSTAAGRLMADMLASVASYETEVRRERVQAGIAAAKMNGKRIGGSKPGRAIKLTPDVYLAIHRLKEDGKSVSAICRIVKVSRPTVYKALGK